MDDSDEPVTEYSIPTLSGYGTSRTTPQATALNMSHMTWPMPVERAVRLFFFSTCF